MQTLLTSSAEEAARLIRQGEVVAFPTETVYGLGADAFSEAAVRKLFAAKERPADNPLIVHLADLGQLEQVAAHVSATAALLIDRFFPGPLTLILPRHPRVPAVVSAGLDTVGIRMPRHPVAQAFLAACATPVAAPSANRSGRPSPTTWQAVRADLDGRIACILQGDQSEVGLESTVLDCTGPVPAVLRAGAVTVERLRAVLPAARIEASDRVALARSPGTRHRHYAPRARVRLTRAEAAEGAPQAAYIGLHPPPHAETFGRLHLCGDVSAYARALFDFFRRCDEEGIQTIFCETVEPVGLGLALMDRLRRAAQG